MHVETVSVLPNTPEWLKHRASCYNASELAAAMGLSKYQSRDDLIKRLATGITPEVDAMTQARFDKGHANEAKTLPVAEEIIGESLYATVLAAQVPELSRKLSASFDGLTILQDVSWENKSPNVALVESLKAGSIPPEYHPQMEQGMMLSGSYRCLFTAGDGETVVHLWYHSNPELRAKIIPTWKQLEADVAAYVPTESAPVAVAAPVEALPAVSVRMDGALAVVSNLPAFGQALKAFVAKMPAKPSTDQEFADTDAACKALKKAEEALEVAESNALASMADVEAMRRMVADFRTLARSTRLAAEKLVASRKEQIRAEIVREAEAAKVAHIRTLNAAMPSDLMPQVPSDFGGVIKGKKTVDSIRDAVNTELARVKIAASEIATRIHLNITAIEDSKLVVHDMAQLVLKAPEDLANVLAVRRADQERREAEARERIRAEEQAKAEKAAREKLEQEQREAAQKAAAEEAAKAPAQVKPEYQAELDAQVRAAEERRARELATHVAIDAVVNRTATVVPMPTKAPAADTSARIKLGDLNAAIAPLSITADGLAALGFPVVATDKTSKLYRLADMPAMLAAMVQHIQAVQEKQAA